MHTNEKEQRPVVSLCITCFNQANYIADSIRSALNQTYSPLEIIIADDKSSDNTADIIAKIVREYNDTVGLHKIIFIRNEENIGLAKNYEQVFMAASGSLIVTGAGDDISFPYRVEEIVNAWQADGAKATVVAHPGTGIDAAGKLVGEIMPPSFVRPIGALMAYSKQIVTEFKPIVSRYVFEDDVYSHRALILGNGLILRKPLMYYRVGSGSSTKGALHERRLHVSEVCINSMGQTWIDLKSKKENLSAQRYEELKREFCSSELIYRCEYRMYATKNFLRRLRWHCLHQKLTSCHTPVLTFVRWILPDKLVFPLRVTIKFVQNLYNPKRRK